jgi:Zn-dependent peptidase ImmA (M78 family)
VKVIVHDSWTFGQLYDLWETSGKTDLSEFVESEALRTLHDFSSRHGALRLPLPIDDLLHDLSLPVEFVELATGILGTLVTGPQVSPCVVISDELDWYTHPKRLGEYALTLAHEVGHFLLQQSSVDVAGLDEPQQAQTMCRTHRKRRTRDFGSDVYRWNETLMDLFAAFLLMPREELHDAWRRILPDVDYVMYPIAGSRGADVHRALRPSAASPIPRLDWVIAKRLAPEFGVTAPAIRKQLKLIGRLVPNTAHQFRRKNDAIATYLNGFPPELACRLRSLR